MEEVVSARKDDEGGSPFTSSDPACDDGFCSTTRSSESSPLVWSCRVDVGGNESPENGPATILDSFGLGVSVRLAATGGCRGSPRASGSGAASPHPLDVFCKFFRRAAEELRGDALKRLPLIDGETSIAAADKAADEVGGGAEVVLRNDESAAASLLESRAAALAAPAAPAISAPATARSSSCGSCACSTRLFVLAMPLRWVLLGEFRLFPLQLRGLLDILGEKEKALGGMNGNECDRLDIQS